MAERKVVAITGHDGQPKNFDPPEYLMFVQFSDGEQGTMLSTIVQEKYPAVFEAYVASISDVQNSGYMKTAHHLALLRQDPVEGFTVRELATKLYELGLLGLGKICTSKRTPGEQLENVCKCVDNMLRTHKTQYERIGMRPRGFRGMMVKVYRAKPTNTTVPPIVTLRQSVSACHDIMQEVPEIIQSAGRDTGRRYDLILKELVKCIKAISNPPTVGLVGQSGAGKSTLTDVIGRLLKISDAEYAAHAERGVVVLEAELISRERSGEKVIFRRVFLADDKVADVIQKHNDIENLAAGLWAEKSQNTARILEEMKKYPLVDPIGEPTVYSSTSAQMLVFEHADSISVSWKMHTAERWAQRIKDAIRKDDENKHTNHEDFDLDHENSGFDHENSDIDHKGDAVEEDGEVSDRDHRDASAIEDSDSDPDSYSDSDDDRPDLEVIKQGCVLWGYEEDQWDDFKNDKRDATIEELACDLNELIAADLEIENVIGEIELGARHIIVGAGRSVVADFSMVHKVLVWSNQTKIQLLIEGKVKVGGFPCNIFDPPGFNDSNARNSSQARDVIEEVTIPIYIPASSGIDTPGKEYLLEFNKKLLLWALSMVQPDRLKPEELQTVEEDPDRQLVILGNQTKHSCIPTANKEKNRKNFFKNLRKEFQDIATKIMKLEGGLLKRVVAKAEERVSYVELHALPAFSLLIDTSLARKYVEGEEMSRGGTPLSLDQMTKDTDIFVFLEKLLSVTAPAIQQCERVLEWLQDVHDQDLASSNDEPAPDLVQSDVGDNQGTMETSEGQAGGYADAAGVGVSAKTIVSHIDELIEDAIEHALEESSKMDEKQGNQGLEQLRERCRGKNKGPAATKRREGALSVINRATLDVDFTRTRRDGWPHPTKLVFPTILPETLRRVQKRVESAFSESNGYEFRIVIDEMLGSLREQRGRHKASKTALMMWNDIMRYSDALYETIKGNKWNSAVGRFLRERDYLEKALDPIFCINNLDPKSSQYIYKLIAQKVPKCRGVAYDLLKERLYRDMRLLDDNKDYTHRGQEMAGIIERYLQAHEGKQNPEKQPVQQVESTSKIRQAQLRLGESIREIRSALDKVKKESNPLQMDTRQGGGQMVARFRAMRWAHCTVENGAHPGPQLEPGTQYVRGSLMDVINYHLQANNIDPASIHSLIDFAVSNRQLITLPPVINEGTSANTKNEFLSFVTKLDKSGGEAPEEVVPWSVAKAVVAACNESLGTDLQIVLADNGQPHDMVLSSHLSPEPTLFKCGNWYHLAWREEEGEMEEDFGGSMGDGESEQGHDGDGNEEVREGKRPAEDFDGGCTQTRRKV